MCGIIGELSFQGTVNPSTIEQMSACIRHRGPDDSGQYVQGPVGLGFRRLAILDLSPSGHQPMANADQTLWIVFNGEIYNFLEERRALEKLGYSFKSRSDTEVILALYEEYGEKFLDHLRGMFALALWDSRQGQLIIARDRIGKKPLKYYADDQGIVFGSELKALLKHPRVPRQVDPVAIHHYLTLQYVPAPLTGFQNIRKLHPGHYLRVRQGEITEHQYWQLNVRDKKAQSQEAWIEQIRTTMEDCVKHRMMSDVPLGAFLSGGIDSSAVVAYMAKHSSHPVKTFSIGFGEKSHNELPYAQQVAKLFGTDHTEFVVEPKAIDILPHLAYHYEEPFADSSALPTYYLAQMTRQHVTVALNGDGGDENFAGYDRYPIFALADRLRRWLPTGVRQALGVGVGIVAQAYASTMTDRVSRFVTSLNHPPARRYLEYMQYFSDEWKSAIYTKEFQTRVPSAPTWKLIETLMAGAGTRDVVDQLLYADIQSYLPDDLLAKVDIATMAVSLEGRSPLLDHHMLELTASMPSALKIYKGQKKYIFRQALRGIIPDAILDRKKMGFGVPIEQWFRGELKAYLREHLLDGRFAARNILQPAAVERLIHQHQTGKVSYAYQLWALLMLELWYEQYFD